MNAFKSLFAPMEPLSGLGRFAKEEDNGVMRFSLSSDDKKEFGLLLKAFDSNVGASERLNEAMADGDPSLLKHAKLLKNEDYERNPYFLSVTPAPTKSGAWELTYDSYEPRQVFLSDNVASLGAPYYEEKNPTAYFATPFHFLALKEKGTTWMSVIPHEINTMKGPLSLMKGRLVVMGLGLGYFAFQALAKKEVSEVTVIEKDPRLIKLFNDSLLAFMPHKEKLTIVEGDAFDLSKVGFFLKKADSVFYDIWHDEEDGLEFYEKALKQEKESPTALHSYWMEEGLLAFYRRLVIVVMDEEMNHPEDRLDEPDSLMGRTQKALKGQFFSSYAEIAEALSDDNLKSLLKSL